MRAINHALTGAIIGVASGNPWVAAPAAIISHFLLDAIPHHGAEQDAPGTRGFALSLVFDALLCTALVAILAIWKPEHWLLAASCAFLATSPDLMWIGRFLRARRGQTAPKFNALLRFHSRIQWFQRPVGVVVEIVWLISMSWLLFVLGR